MSQEANIRAWQSLHDRGYFESRPQYAGSRLEPGCGTGIVDKLGLERHHRTLDFGCGYGRVMHDLAPALDSIVGVDIHEAPLEQARVLLAPFPSASVVLYDGLILPFAAGSFDAIYATSVIQHMGPEGVEMVMREMRRVLAPGGRVLLQSLAAPYPAAVVEHRGGEDSIAWTVSALAVIGYQVGLVLCQSWMEPGVREAKSLWALFR